MKTRTDTQYIQKLIEEGEHVQQDFKFTISDARKIARSLSAFSNTQGGRLLIGVKDNGKIAGIRSEEEIYMIEAAAHMYCSPQIDIEKQIHHIEGKYVLEVGIKESTHKPVYAIDECNKAWAFVRIKDENILASPVQLHIWKHQQTDSVIITYTEREHHLLDVLKQHESLTLNQCSRLARIDRKTTSELLADFIRFDLVEQDFKEHTFYFKLKGNE